MRSWQRDVHSLLSPYRSSLTLHSSNDELQNLQMMVRWKREWQRESLAWNFQDLLRNSNGIQSEAIRKNNHASMIWNKSYMKNGKWKLDEVVWTYVCPSLSSIRKLQTENSIRHQTLNVNKQNLIDAERNETKPIDAAKFHGSHVVDFDCLAPVPVVFESAEQTQINRM